MDKEYERAVELIMKHGTTMAYALEMYARDLDGDGYTSYSATMYGLADEVRRSFMELAMKG
jgi:hypothetical protein